jgi:hypothetical protein
MTGAAASYPEFPPFPSLAIGTDGTVFIAWADHAEGDWDAVVSRSSDGGLTWTAPTNVSDVTAGDQWMLTIAVDARDLVHAAWYDGRSGSTDVRYATSSDRGATWSASIQVNTVSTPGTRNRLGDYLGLAVARDGTAHVAWTDVRSGDMDIFYTNVTARDR